jgi:hypothetical protein
MSLAGAWCLDGFAMLAVIEKVSGRWIGRVGPWWPEGWSGSEIGWAFTALGWTQIIHSISPDNVRSQAVARKLGAGNRGLGRLLPPYEHAVVDIWGHSRVEWYAAHPA